MVCPAVSKKGRTRPIVCGRTMDRPKFFTRACTSLYERTKSRYTLTTIGKGNSRKFLVFLLVCLLHRLLLWKHLYLIYRPYAILSLFYLSRKYSSNQSEISSFWSSCVGNFGAPKKFATTAITVASLVTNTCESEAIRKPNSIQTDVLS